MPIKGYLAKTAQIVKNMNKERTSNVRCSPDKNVALYSSVLLLTLNRSGVPFEQDSLFVAVEAALEEQKTEAEIEENMAARK